jgi:hypothetical protein
MSWYGWFVRKALKADWLLWFRPHFGSKQHNIGPTSQLLSLFRFYLAFMSSSPLSHPIHLITSIPLHLLHE